MISMSSKTFTVLAVIVVVISIIIGLGVNLHTEVHTVEVIKTDIAGNNEHYMVFCQEDGKSVTYTLDDSLLFGQFNTADKFATIVAGKTYTFKVQGVRIPILSIFQNIIEITPISTE